MSIITNLLNGYNELRMYQSKSNGPWEFVITVFYCADTLFIKSNSLPFYSNIWNPDRFMWFTIALSHHRRLCR